MLARTLTSGIGDRTRFGNRRQRRVDQLYPGAKAFLRALSGRKMYRSVVHNKVEVPMVIVSVNEARRNLADLINTVTQGQQVAISRRGKPVVQLSAIQTQERPRLPDLAEFRKSLGKPPRKSAATIRHLRELERY